MPSTLWVMPALAAALLAAPAVAQERTPRFTEEQLAAILKPELHRSLSPGVGPEPGEPGSGVVPDLNVLFDFDSAELTPEAKAQLDVLGRVLQREELRSYRFRIGGHTDDIGSDSYNEDLSHRRARAVVSYLAGNFGVQGGRLEAKGYGESEPADPQNPESGVNRRVEVCTLVRPHNKTAPSGACRPPG